MSGTAVFAGLLRHAELYGSDCVYETARACLAAGELARLRIELDGLEAKTKRPRQRAGRPKRRRPSEETLAAAVALRAQGLAIGAIADKLGVSEKTVKEHLATARRRQREASEPAAPSTGVEVGCRCGWRQRCETLEQALDAQTGHRCATRPGDAQEEDRSRVSDPTSKLSQTAWLSGEFTAKTTKTTRRPCERSQPQKPKEIAGPREDVQAQR